MIVNIRYLFQSTDHKKIMLVGLYIVGIISHFVISAIFAYRGEETVFFIKFGIALVTGILFYYYLKSGNTKLYAILLMVLMEFDVAYTVLNGYIFNFTTIYPFIFYVIFGVYLFGFFFFFKLKDALIATVLHYMYWIIVTVFGHYIYLSKHLMIDFMTVFSMFATSLVILAFCIFYYFSTEVPYKVLEKDDKLKEMLLREIHHRIKNNLNMMGSVLGLQILSLNNLKQKEAKEVLINSKLRLEAIAMIHEALYKSQNIEKVFFKEYAQNLTGLINRAYNRNILVQIDSDHIFLPLETIFRLGIILNEIFINSIKYAFVDERDGDEIKISLSQKENHFHFTYNESRNENIDIKKMLESKSLGMRLVRLTVRQLSGTFEVTKNNGLIFTIDFLAS
jgi:two-component sensor histidine kinase